MNKQHYADSRTPEEREADSKIEVITTTAFDCSEATLLEKKRIENIIVRHFHDHKDKECENDKALKAILKAI